MSLRYNIKDINTSISIYFKDLTEHSYLDYYKVLLENQDIDVFPKTETDKSYKNVADYIYRIITHSNFLCKGLNADYVKQSFETSDAVIVLGTTGIDILPNGNIFGFALIQFNDVDNSIYIDVICSHIGMKYAGDMLIRKIENICKSLYMTQITLKSVATAIPFYEKYGFTKLRDCNTSANTTELCEMVKIIPYKSTGGKKKYRTRKNKTNTHKRKHKKSRKTKRFR